MSDFNYSYLPKSLAEKIREICDNGFTNYTEKASLIIAAVKNEANGNIYLTTNMFDEESCKDLVNVYKALAEDRIVFKVLTPMKNNC